MDIDQIHLIAFIGIILSAMVGAVLIFYPISRRQFHPNVILGFAFFCSAYLVLIRLINISDLILQYPFFFYTGLLAFTVYLPLPYLYLRLLIKRISLRLHHAFLSAPFVFTMFNFLPYFLMDKAEKTVFVEQYYFPELFDQPPAKSYLFVSPDVFSVLLFSLLMFFFILQFLQVVSLYRIKEDLFWKENDSWVRWLSLYFVIQTIFVVPIPVMFYFSDLNIWWTSTSVLISIAAIITAIYLVARPEILYGLKGGLVLQSEPSLEKSIEAEERANPIQRYQFISDGQIEVVSKRLETYLSDHHPYLKKGYSINELASEIAVSPKLLSLFLNVHLGQNFFDFINCKRVKYLANCLDEETLRNKTLETIADEIGFNNRTSFVNAVKKHAQMTPSNYLESILQQRKNDVI
jgi:AraC-like DNA-binding protein